MASYKIAEELDEVSNEVSAKLNKIYCENCEALLCELDSESVDMVLTSPPYDNLREYHSKFDINIVTDQLYRITKSGGVVVWVVGDATINGSETGTSFRQALRFKDAGFNLHDTMIYQKRNYIPLTHNRYEQCFEYMFVFSKGRPKTFNPIMVDTKGAGESENWARRGYCSTVRTGAQRRRDEIRITNDKKIHKNIFTYTCGLEQCSHPAPFPRRLSIDQILTWSNPGDVVLDPFMGSGTTAIACVEYSRNYIGIEISGEYCEIAERRIEEAQSQIRLDLRV